MWSWFQDPSIMQPPSVFCLLSFFFFSVYFSPCLSFAVGYETLCRVDEFLKDLFNKYKIKNKSMDKKSYWHSLIRSSLFRTKMLLNDH